MRRNGGVMVRFLGKHATRHGLAGGAGTLAFLVGINRYPDPRNNLKGCVNDALLMAKTLKEQYGFQTGDVQLLTDNRATTAGIRTGLEQLVSGAQAGDSLFVPLRAEVRRRAFKPAVDACRIVPGALGGSSHSQSSETSRARATRVAVLIFGSFSPRSICEIWLWPRPTMRPTCSFSARPLRRNPRPTSLRIESP